MAIRCYGYRPNSTALHQCLARTHWRTKKHGGSSTCVALPVLKYTILLGHQMESSSSRGVWTMLRGYTMLRLVNLIPITSEASADMFLGQMVRQIAEHNHYVQGVAWDPLNEYIATQSSDRSVHIYSLKTKDGQPTLSQHNKVTKMDLPGQRISASSPAPQEVGSRTYTGLDSASLAPASPGPSMPGTPTSLALPMNPPAISHSRRSSFGSSPSMRRSASPAPSMPLPAVRPMENSPNPYLGAGIGIKNASIYANETHTSFFRRLTFTPDGSLLFTPAGQYRTPHLETVRSADDVINTVYIYTRAGLNRPPIAHLPGHKKPSIAVKCSPVLYTHRLATKPTAQITLDTSSAEEAIADLPEPVVPSKAPSTLSAMDPPPSTSTTMPSPSDVPGPSCSPRTTDLDTSAPTPGPSPAFALPYRIVYAVATQDAVLVYDTQQQTPLVVVSNLHYATFTDVTWYEGLICPLLWFEDADRTLQVQ